MTYKEFCSSLGEAIKMLIERGYLEDKEEYEFSEIQDASAKYFEDKRKENHNA